MTMTNDDEITAGDPPDAGQLPEGHRWDEAGEAWGVRSGDWATLFEHYSLDVLLATLPALGVGPGTRILDVACGSGLGVRVLAGAGADAAGIDASAPLVELARERTPEADLRVGTMFDLPWADESFDAVVSLNGIWGGCEAALVEARRVLVPGGRIAITFWGRDQLDLRPVFTAFALRAPADHLEGMRRTNGISRPGTAETMLEAAGFTIETSDVRMSVLEWPDLDTAWRAMASIGPAQPALALHGADVLRPEVEEALASLVAPSGIVRMRNELRFVVARR